MAATDRSVAGGYLGRHSEFVRSFVDKRGQKTQRPRVLSADERAAHRKELSRIQNLQPALAEETKINISFALRRWKAQVYSISDRPLLGTTNRAQKVLRIQQVTGMEGRHRDGSRSPYDDGSPRLDVQHIQYQIGRHFLAILALVQIAVRHC